MTRSLGEVDAMARKAARGAGYAWGLAEEAGSAVRWLEARGLDGCAALAATLQTVDQGLDGFSPDADWTSASGALCPVMTGAALSDQIADFETELSFGPVIAPILLVPVVAYMAMQRQQDMTLEAGSGRAVVNGGGLRTEGPFSTGACAVTIRAGGAGDGGALQVAELRTRSDVLPDIWDQLDHFATKTYAPATEASRLKGAGAGLTDND